MQILSEVSRPYLIESLTAPVGVSHFWTFSGHMLDFKLEEFSYLEETIGSAVKIRVQNLEFIVPTSWHVLAMDKETSSIDCLPIANCATHDHNVLLFSPDDGKPVTTRIAVVDFLPKTSVYHPMVPKGSMLVHPTGPEISHGKQIFYGVIMGPYDLYRWIGGKTIGDILT